MPDPATLVISVLIIAFTGLLIGCIGVGGVIMVPALTWFTDLSVHVAISAVMFSYLFSGLAGAWLYSRKGSIHWSSCLWLSLGAMPGAYYGAVLVAGMPDNTVKLVIAAFVVFAGANTLLQRKHNNTEAPHISPLWLVGIGVIVGISSSMTGTGGPLLLAPLLIWLKWPLLIVVGVVQFIQVPVSLMATFGNVMHGDVNFTLGLGIAAVMVVGVTVGSSLSHRVPAEFLRKLVGVVLASTGVFMIWQNLQAV